MNLWIALRTIGGLITMLIDAGDYIFYAKSIQQLADKGALPEVNLADAVLGVFWPHFWWFIGGLVFFLWGLLDLWYQRNR